jgi:Uma2 family endonuclease
MYVQFPGRGRVFAAPCDVQLAEDRVVQPDVLVVLNERRDIITPERIVGAPDLVVEIASQRTASYDRSEKQQGYAQAGVPEYWIADPHAHTVEVLVLDVASGKNRDGNRERDEGATIYHSLGVFRGNETLPSRVVPDFPVCVEQFFSGL